MGLAESGIRTFTRRLAIIEQNSDSDELLGTYYTVIGVKYVISKNLIFRSRTENIVYNVTFRIY